MGIHQGLLEELRSTVLKPVLIKPSLHLVSVHSHPIILGVRHDPCLFPIWCFVREECLTLSHYCPGFFVSLSQNISRAEKRNKDDWQLGAESHQLFCWQAADVRKLLTCRRVTADWQPGTARQGRRSLLRSSGAAILTHSRSRHTVPGWQTSVLALGCRLLRLLETLQGAESFAFLRKKIRLGYYLCLRKTFPPNYFHSRYQDMFQMRFL